MLATARSGVTSCSSVFRQRDACPAAGLRAAPGGRRQRASALRVAAKLTKDGPHVCIVGTTGAVGQEFLAVRGGVGRQRAGRPAAPR